MTPDQRHRLEVIQAKVAEVLLTELDPANWSGADTNPAELTKEARGNRLFDKKNAVVTTMIYMNNAKLMENTKPALGRDPYKDDEMERQIAAAEKTAASLLKDLQKPIAKPHAKAGKKG